MHRDRLGRRLGVSHQQGRLGDGHGLHRPLRGCEPTRQPGGAFFFSLLSHCNGNMRRWRDQLASGLCARNARTTSSPSSFTSGARSRWPPRRHPPPPRSPRGPFWRWCFCLFVCRGKDISWVRKSPQSRIFCKASSTTPGCARAVGVGARPALAIGRALHKKQTRSRGGGRLVQLGRDPDRDAAGRGSRHLQIGVLEFMTAYIPHSLQETPRFGEARAIEPAASHYRDAFFRFLSVRSHGSHKR